MSVLTVSGELLTPGQSLQRRSRDVQRRAADVVLDVLAEAGVDTVFGLPGGSIAPVYDAMLARPELRSITVRIDGNAVFAAAGYAQATGKLGVALVTSGPGVLNCMNALASAYTDGLPVLLIAGEAPRRGFGRGAIQEGSNYNLNVVGMATPITKLAVEVPHATAVAPMLRRAIATALSGKRGPVFVSLPLDVLGQRVSLTRGAHQVSTQFEISESLVMQAARALQSPGRKLIFVGSGTRWGEAPRLLRELAERLQIPVVTTPKGKGIFPEDHPLSLGVFGMGGHPSARQFPKQGIDTLLVIGSSLNEVATDGWSPHLQPRRCLVHVDIDAARLGRVYPTDLAVAAPAEHFLRALLPHIDVRAPAATYGPTYAEDREQLDLAAAGLPPIRALWELQQAVPDDTIFTTDSGNNLFFALHYIVAKGPDRVMTMLGLGSMGTAIPTALGAKAAHPERTVVAITGDGGFLMSASEISVAAQHGLPIVVFVLNDFRYNMVETGNRNVYGRTASFSTEPLDVPSIARGLGAASVVATKPEQVSSLCLRGLQQPLVIDARILPHSRIPPNRRFETISKNLLEN